MTTFQLTIVAPDRTVVDEVTDSVSAPGVQGYFGVWAGHEPFVTQLKPGVVAYNDAAGKTQYVAVAGGFLEAAGDHVIILADAAEAQRDIDIERARAALERAKKRLEAIGEGVDAERARAAADRAMARIMVAEKR
ncbi:MAG: F0F1 ATP synthase subunit epsilon [Armatimonadetes bacterium]|nr:MAG: F0F1 ATP synthase subunit epsilon [Armatimonadota bacterium]GIV02170.1 MAG: ATP synthase epsilon chain [Fimbriimonadales bacterium]